MKWELLPIHFHFIKILRWSFQSPKTYHSCVLVSSIARSLLLNQLVFALWSREQSRHSSAVNSFICHLSLHTGSFVKLNINCLSKNHRITGMPRVKIVVCRDMPASVVILQRQMSFAITLFSEISSSFPFANSFSLPPSFSALSIPSFCSWEQFLKNAPKFLTTIQSLQTWSIQQLVWRQEPVDEQRSQSRVLAGRRRGWCYSQSCEN